ncbi:MULTISPECIES: hypothetical protein [unclassified Arenibacter]|jgi:hypothetical protein|uniref:hypothetical protein n=1 Tax=unclassified Arenibacter TaxID=2615047 RepID=UPI000E354A2B|nr:MULTISPECIES: hypothetical protein [unclassified Arenibacter]MCM4163560.1 hypothetical protein [Arenibacter sp. A80]RFT56292.1 hypothetical protein D0S24_08100 [Arenibacter sp. P308M17]
MSYKIKSLLYFICFLISAIVYNNLSDNSEATIDRISIKKSKVTLEALADNSANQFKNIQ